MSEADTSKPSRIALLGVPIEIGASQAGPLMGPDALRTAGLARLRTGLSLLALAASALVFGIFPRSCS